MQVVSIAFLALLTVGHGSSAATPPGPPIPGGGQPQAAAWTPTAEQLLDRYDQSMAALRRSRVTNVTRGELAYSWKASQWTRPPIWRQTI